jgi:hypothetical protein
VSHPPRTKAAALLGRRSAFAVALGAGLALALAACAPAGIPPEIPSAVEQASSAVQTTILAVSLDEKQRSVPGVSTTSADDMLKEIQDAQKSVTDVEVSGREAADARDAALDAIREGTTAILLARDSLPGLTGDSADAVDDALSSSADALDAVAKQYGEAR